MIAQLVEDVSPDIAEAIVERVVPDGEGTASNTRGYLLERPIVGGRLSLWDGAGDLVLWTSPVLAVEDDETGRMVVKTKNSVYRVAMVR
jgi:hypothetical protein